MWQHYREHSLRIRFQLLIEEGQITQEDADAFSSYISLSRMPSVTVYLLGKHFDETGAMAANEGYRATARVFEAMQLNEIPIDLNSSEKPDFQFWRHLDYLFELSEEGLREELPFFVVDPRQQDKVNAILEGRLAEAVGLEETKSLN